MIDVGTAGALLDFGARIGQGPQAREQLKGAVAMHNILAKRRVAYLADEVGMGKTYVALGALALFRHYNPDFRVLIIAPRENIQNKWMKEWRNFVKHHVKFPDLRVKGLDDRPTRPLVSCGNLLELIHEVTLNPNRDFFVRLTSFSLPVAGKDTVDPETARRLRDGLRRHLPWMRDELFDLRNKQVFKDNFARAVCCALPRFDLVIVDEGHNLKHGFGEHVSARNRVLALAMGHASSGADSRLFPGFGPRADKVLFLSATPVEETYVHLWNQLNVFGLAGPYARLCDRDVEEEAKKALAGEFLVRRVTQIRIGEEEYTKNLYRREWRRGGVFNHDEPIRVSDSRQRLIVALVQKKVSELLGDERFNSSFQIGMLASFESFLETARLKREEDTVNFDDAEQTDDRLEREGIDVADVNRLSQSYRNKFGCEMPHPKMDSLVESLSRAWLLGEKALIFVRRVASVKELKRKLDERYDAWLMARLRSELPTALEPRLTRLFEQYLAERRDAESMRRPQQELQVQRPQQEDIDQGGKDTFFAWFFRGDGPRGVISGANIQQRFIQRGAAYSTFFEDNYVADVLACQPGEVEARLADALHIEPGSLRSMLRERSKSFLPHGRKQARADRFEAVQAAAIESLKDVAGPCQEQARIIWHERFEQSKRRPHVSEAPDIGDWLELPTFFTELRRRDELRKRLWPHPSHLNLVQRFRERELRAQLLASAARLGHAFIDLYVLSIRRLGSLDLRAKDLTEDDSKDLEVARINEYLDLLDKQMGTPRRERSWSAFDELADLAEHFDLMLDVNEPEARAKPLQETARIFGRLLGQQQPVGGMSGQVNQTLVRQFRMPGYPLVLISTDLLQEGEDLHTFCSAVHHYGIAWTPSAMEQRIGRVDRVRSHTERRLTALKASSVRGEDLLQVYFPHLEDTVEVLQVQRVLERMNVFLRLMHEGLISAGKEERLIDIKKEFLRDRRDVGQILQPLKSAFPVKAEHLGREPRELAVGPELWHRISDNFSGIVKWSLPGLIIKWESLEKMEPGILLGTAWLKNRIQPFSLLLKSFGSQVAVRCISPIGCVSPGESHERIVASAAASPVCIGAIMTREPRTYDLTVESGVLLSGDAETDRCRVAMLVRRVVHQADALEQEHLPGRDERLDTFRGELQMESGCGS